ncbi:serine hydrolase domain-containing protein [Saccharothrix syringae]|uniref:Class A beta-lactamase-related serine hydrolase n=1 Tax=Saccharothrix syringae TaxID=103733 RepID=A0A5Q0HC71_SACSY|nr:serine hydrolase domain-containing protein [Saccharothrix syringae]QFZ23769.1 class A beta-lactamase-related serine hydrolase [Saccharothrix syringae]
MSSTTRRTATAALTAAAVAAALVTAPAARAAPSRLHDAVHRAVDAAGVPGVAVRVDDGGRVVETAHQARWTLADHRLRAGDRFKMASNTKTVTATVALQLDAEGALDLDDPVERWLPGTVPDGGAITVRMLLNQTSGLFDYLDDPRLLGLLTGRAPRPWPPAELVAVAVSHPPLFAPGERWDYSNTNYTLAGMVVERAAGRPYADLVRQRITGPLGLRDTHLSTEAAFRGAHGYEPDAGHLAPLLPPGTPVGDGFAGPERHDHVDTTGIDLGPAWAAGGLVSTARDWQRFLTALLSGRLLPAAQLAELLDTVPQGTGDGYGLGVMEVRTPCGAVWGHSGGFPGYRSHNYADRAGRRAVTVLLTTTFGLRAPEAAAAERELVEAAVCRMYGR